MGATAPTEFTGKAGDVIFKHHMICHTSSMNVVEGKPRIGIFGSWRHQALIVDEPGTNIEPPDYEPLDSPVRKEQQRYHTPENLWEVWSDEVKAAGGGTGGARL